MRLELLIPVLALAFACLGLAIVVMLVGKQKRLEERVLANIPRGRPTPRNPTLGGPNVRIRPMESPRWQTLNRLLNIPVDLPLAHVVSPVWILAVTTTIAVAIGWEGRILVSWWFSVLDALLAWIILTRTAFDWELTRYRGRLLRQMPDTIHLVISATRAGLPVSESFRMIVQEMANPTGAEFARVVDEMTLGMSADDALLSMHRRTGVTEYAIFAVTIGVQARSGGRLAETITNLADTVRDRIAVAGKARALSAEARTASLVMTALPVFSAVLLQFTRPGYLQPLVDDPRGQTMLTVGVVALILGILSMRQMVRGAIKD
jgi:tight adherence protein B